MAFTTEELRNIAATTLDFYMKRGKVKSQNNQDRPLLKKLEAKEKNFPGGKEFIDLGVKGISDTALQGIVGNSTVTYRNPTNVRRAKYPWRYLHDGMSCSIHELMKNGIHVSDTTTGKGVSSATDAEKVQLANLYEEKLDDLTEGYERGKNKMFWLDGTQDATLVPGITSFILENPASATVVAGIDQSLFSWWRNRAVIGMDASDPEAQTIVTTLQREWRILRKNGGNPDTVLAGSDFLEAFEQELRAKGTYTQIGWAKSGMIDGSIADVGFKGVMFEYDPTLDDMGKSKYCYVLDMKHIMLMPITDEKDRKHNPARPVDQYTIYLGLTWAGGLACDQRNCHGVYSIA